MKAFGQTGSDSSWLSGVASGKALSDSVATMKQLHEAKLVMKGAPRTAPVVSTLTPADKPTAATVKDCLDVSGWHQVDAANGALKDPAQRLSRYPATVKLSQVNGSWIVIDVTREVGKTC
ncbi:hypothetical protein [Kitasatospora sp. MMS16-BH015]|uniref:hypothetical protein n=1 Tax=Kitasatospora sp. MMS16-BH015 TaxID=2018025 RepID=UPI000CF253DE|nr:hypothetical protein [Kitasatospora sp. MMS16-BH015]